MPPFTITHCFSTCSICKSHVNSIDSKSLGDFSGLGFMYDFVSAALRPELLQYKPKSDLRYAIQNRFALGFNTQDTTQVICDQLLTGIQNSLLADFPVWSGEYKAKQHSQSDSKVVGPGSFEEDLKIMKSFVDGSGSCRLGGPSKTLHGFSVFEFQESYFKGPGEMRWFGIYGLGKKQLTETQPVEHPDGGDWRPYPVWCLFKKRNDAGDSWVDAVARVFSGKAWDDNDCSEDVSSDTSLLALNVTEPLSVVDQATETIV
eukprot:TRINITY_DN99778_c0_g1_i1.p1 TRINITY_DN99778_c0_g1~~TRINITY_DN99778_c0_g1_i1.p1  ORF type:complete len:260 (+),score=36.75 TRINITY_DN99778_c0_g1_i1:2-781(+)